MEQENKNENDEATWKEGLAVWWWIFWNCLSIGLLASIILGAITGAVTGALIMSEGELNIQLLRVVYWLKLLLSLGLGIVINLYFTKKMLGRKFKGFSVVVKRDETNQK